MSSVLNATIQSYQGNSFYQKQILSLLAKMNLGRLNLSLPNGELIQIGNGEVPITANVQGRNETYCQRCVVYVEIGVGEAYT